MNLPSKRRHFVDTGSPKRECENFQHHTFRDLDLSTAKTPISFVRSDFRGAVFDAARFRGNDFHHADFLDAAIRNSEFVECRFDIADVSNSYFDHTAFAGNSYDSTSITQCTFNHCTFSRERFARADIRSCHYRDSALRGCDFEMASCEDLHFVDCALERVDIAVMSARNFYFQNTTFNEVIVDADYLATYRFKAGLPSALKYRYRGNLLDLTLEKASVLYDFTKHFLATERFDEFFNLMLLINGAGSGHQHVAPILRKVLVSIQTMANQRARWRQTEQVLNTLEFYFGSGVVTFDDYLQMVRILHEPTMQPAEAKERFLYLGRVGYLQELVTSAAYDLEYTASQIGHGTLFAELVVESDSIEDATLRVEQLCAVVTEVGGGPAASKPYRIIGWHAGSVVVELIGTSAFMLLLLKVIRETVQTAVSVGISYVMAKKVVALLEKASTVKDLSELDQLHVTRLALTREQKATVRDALSPIKELRLYANAAAHRD